MDNILAFFHSLLTAVPDRNSQYRPRKKLSFLTDVHIKLISLTSQGSMSRRRQTLLADIKEKTFIIRPRPTMPLKLRWGGWEKFEYLLTCMLDTVHCHGDLHKMLYEVFHESQSLTMHYIRDERGDEALTLCRPMGLGFPAVRTRQEGKEKRYERQ